MIALIGALCAMLVFAGGYVATTDLLSGLLLTSFGVIGLGTLVAYLQNVQSITSLDSPTGLTLDQLHYFTLESPTLDGNTPVYVGDSGLHPAGSVFACILDGHRVVVVERLAETPEVDELF